MEGGSDLGGDDHDGWLDSDVADGDEGCCYDDLGLEGGSDGGEECPGKCEVSLRLNCSLSAALRSKLIRL